VVLMIYFKLDNNMADKQHKQSPILQGQNSGLRVELVTEGLSLPTSMAFIDKNNILVLEKDGEVRLISNGVLQKHPALKVQVNTTSERGLLGIATVNGDGGSSSRGNGDGYVKTAERSTNRATKTPKVFLYFTESKPGKPLSNGIYKYGWDGKNLVNQTLILDLPAEPGPNHDGGKLKIGPDHNLYAVIGDLNEGDSLLQNFKNGKPPHDSSVILRVNPNDGSPANNNPFLRNGVNSDNNVLARYYAYGIRNSFGMTFDPITGSLWDTENGPDAYDEINIIKPGFNSGWQEVMGPISRSHVSEKDMVVFPGSKYTDPVFSWFPPIGVTAIEFLKSSKLGKGYTNNIFVGDINNGNLYYFEVNKTRTGLKFDNNQASVSGLLSDLVADDKSEISTITFGTGFGGITDIDTGPDGFLYILSYGNGNIYRIVPSL
ncbi:MAG: PQQ-dependent sugar dehydrogenase, partial [Nitrososphaeraceae archaeon]